MYIDRPNRFSLRISLIYLVRKGKERKGAGCGYCCLRSEWRRGKGGGEGGGGGVEGGGREGVLREGEKGGEVGREVGREGGREGKGGKFPDETIDDSRYGRMGYDGIGWDRMGWDGVA